MAESDHGELALRVERGQVTDEELAALTVVLLALRAGHEEAEEESERPHNGSRWWRRSHAYQAPRSWQ
jgi:hypothetical protein